MTPILLRVYHNDRLIVEEGLDACTDIGRQPQPADPLYVRVAAVAPSPARWRINIAAREELAISRDSLRLEPLPSGLVRVTNLSPRSLPDVAGSGVIPASGSRDVRPPTLITLANKSLRLETEDSDAADLQRLAEPTIAPGMTLAAQAVVPSADLRAAESEQLIRWFRAVTAVLQSATNSEEFFQRAAEAVVDLVGLNSGRVMLLQNGAWQCAAASFQERMADDLGPARPSQRILARMRQEKRTFWQTMGAASDEASLSGVQAVVAAPILDPRGAVIGALYGDRHGELGIGRPITQLEAMLVEALACSAAAGLARLEQQKAALAAQVRFEQFFTPELAGHLAAQPDMLKGREAEVTLLFCDVRGFSRISERLSPAATVEWIGSVMSVLSDCIIAHQGVLVDYIGDELLAMWGAPAPESRHAQLACAAATDMLQALDGLNRQWQSQLGEPIRVGIGINTGPAHVGNTGSQRKFKYGPLGNTVNLASRVQGATKYLRVDTLITAATRGRLDAETKPRRLCQVRVVNISEPVGLYQLPVGDPAGWQSLCDEYEAALVEFEAGSFRRAAWLLSQLTLKHPDDGPSLALLARTVNLLVNEPAEFNPVWDLPGK